MRIFFDIDGTICQTEKIDGAWDYRNSAPIQSRISHINTLYDEGHEIHYWTARGSSSGIDWTEFTQKQLESWGCKFTSVSTGKPSFDMYICDKSFNSEEYFKENL